MGGAPFATIKSAWEDLLDPVFYLFIYFSFNKTDLQVTVFKLVNHN